LKYDRFLAIPRTARIVQRKRYKEKYKFRLYHYMMEKVESLQAKVGFIYGLTITTHYLLFKLNQFLEAKINMFKIGYHSLKLPKYLINA